MEIKQELICKHMKVFCEFVASIEFVVLTTELTIDRPKHAQHVVLHSAMEHAYNKKKYPETCSAG
jgi:hypothetical protein